MSMKIVVAIDSFKGSITSLEAGAAVMEGIQKAAPSAQIWVRPVADGGEGTVEALTLGMDGHLERIVVTGPLGESVMAAYGIVESGKNVAGKMAVIEMSAAAGITLIKECERNPLQTTTYGVGELIKDAIKNGCRSFLIGIGGSASNDGGIGMLQALGFGLLDEDGRQVAQGAKGLASLRVITDEKVIPELKDCTFRVACDVTNPLCGENGCSAVFGPQKGASNEMIDRMDQWLSDYAALTEKFSQKADRMLSGSGAAGGLGFAFLSYMNAVLESGIGIILEETKLEEYIRQADIVVTGEGRLDSQTVMGKAPIGVAEIAKKYGKRVIAFSGSVSEDAVICNEHGIDAFFPILRETGTLDDAMKTENAKRNLAATAEQVFRLLNSQEQV